MKERMPYALQLCFVSTFLYWYPLTIIIIIFMIFVTALTPLDSERFTFKSPTR